MSYRGRGRGGYNNSNQPANRNNGGGFGAPVGVDILGWNGASADECVAFIGRKCRITVSNYTVDPASGVLKGFVASDKDATALFQWAGVRFAGQALRFSRSQDNGGARPSDTIATITNFLKSRYQPDIKMLNLTNVQLDPGLVSTGFFASISTSSKFFPALMKVASDLKLDVNSIDMSSNSLTDLSSISTLPLTFPTLKNLSLLNNNLGRVKVFESWKNKLNYLREIILVGNPVSNTTELKFELMKNFPRLVVVNGEVVRNEDALNNILAFPFGNQPMFFSDADVQGLANNFIANFYKLWDSDRNGLLILYQNESQFSVQVDTAHPHDSDSNTDLSFYIPLSRNITRVSSAKGRAQRLALGPEAIAKLFAQLPGSRHDLSKPELFSMEAYRYPPLNGIMVVLHGSFDEVAAPLNRDAINALAKGTRNRFSGPKKKTDLSSKSFDRTFIIIPTPNGSMIVASDLLLVRPTSSPSAWAATPPPSAPPTAAATPTPQPGQPTAADLPPEVKANLNPQQQEILVRVVLATKLNLQYGVMLCQQSNWDFDTASVNFKNLAALLPPDAFT